MRTFIVSRTDKIGDFVVSIPAYATLKAMYPEDRVIALVSKHNKIIASNLKCVDDYICVDDYKSRRDLVKVIRSCSPDVFIALYSNHKVARLAFSSGAKDRIGPLSKLSSFLFYNKGIRQRRSACVKTEAEYNLDLIRSFDPKLFDSVGIHLETIHIPDREEVIMNKWLSREELHHKPFVILNPYTNGSNIYMSNHEYARIISGFLERCYAKIIDQHEASYDLSLNVIHERKHNANAEHILSDSRYQQAVEYQQLLETKVKDPYLEVSERTALFRHMVPEVVLLGIPSQQKYMEKLISHIDQRFKNHIHMFINHDNLLVAASLIKKCSLFLGPSTGTTHIAGNFKKKAIVFYGHKKSQSHNRWALYGDENEIPFSLSKDLADPHTGKIDKLPDSMFDVIVVSMVEGFYH